MNVKDRQLTPDQQQAIPFLVAAKTLQDGCDAAGITIERLKDWRKRTEFMAALEAAQSEFSKNLLRDVSLVLSRGMVKAAHTLIDLLDSKQDGIKIAAAKAVIEFGIKSGGSGDVENDLTSVAGYLTTSSLCLILKTTKAVLGRLKLKYRERIDTPLINGSTLYWSPESVDQVKTLIEEEERLAEQGRL